MRLIAIIVSLGLFISCVKEDHFGKSEYSNIQALEFKNQLRVPTLDSVNLIYSVQFDTTHDLSKTEVSILQLSNFAKADVAVGTIMDLSKEGSITVTSESGKQSIYTIQASIDYSGGNIQIENSNFDSWREESATIGKYWEIGDNAATSLWSTANEGVTLLNGKDANALRLQVAGTDYAAELVTTAAAAIVRIAAGSLFTGKFFKDRIDINDPNKAVEFGIPFTGRPKKVKVSYQYTPGASNEDANGNVLGYPDSCDIYLKLENRNSGIKRVGTAWYRSSESVTNWTDLEMDVMFGQVPAGSPSYMDIASGESWGNENDPITHISVVFTASARGALFEGAIGSTLKVNDFELIY